MTSAQSVRVLLVDDHPVLRAGLSAVLSAEVGLAVCGEAGDGEDAVVQFERLRPDVTLMDLQMPILDGAAAIGRIREKDSDACIIVLTTFDTDEDVERALRAGARGYILKDASAEELVGTIREVHAGRRRVAPTVVERLTERGMRVPLTFRELTVLRLLSNGKTNKEIAAILSIAEATVKVHLSHLFHKLGVSSRTEALAEATRRGLVRIR